jgi:hypothetical protein
MTPLAGRSNVDLMREIQALERTVKAAAEEAEQAAARQSAVGVREWAAAAEAAADAWAALSALQDAASKDGADA